MLTQYEAQQLQADIKRRFTLDKESAMVTYDEKQRLLRNFQGEPALALGVVAKCAACLLIMAVLAVIGAGTDMRSQAPLNAATTGGSVQHRESSANIEARRVFEERRARFNMESITPTAYASPPRQPGPD